MRKFFAVLFILTHAALVAQDKALADLLVRIGDTVKQATLTPIEKYNRYKPFERSYVGYSHPIMVGETPLNTGGRISLFHSIGFYSSLPFRTNGSIESNTTFEEISNSESIAQLQGASFQNSTFLDSTIRSSGIDYGLIIAPMRSHPLGKNLFLSFGISSTRVSNYHSYSNNSLLDMNDEFIILKSSNIKHGLDVGMNYVLPFLQVGAGYKITGFNPGVYVNAGVNIPVKVILSRLKKQDDFNRRAKQLDHEAKVFDSINF